MAGYRNFSIFIVHSLDCLHEKEGYGSRIHLEWFSAHNVLTVEVKAMRRTALLILAVLFSVAAFGQLGLRTVTSTATETQTSVATSATSTTGTLSLRTVDPLLLSFREGFKAPDDPGWIEKKVGNVSLKLPGLFSVSSQKFGSNYEAQIFDGNGKLFGRFFYYQLEPYDLEELLNAVIPSVYGNTTTGEKSYEETMWMENGMGVYLASLKMVANIDFPVIFVYTPGDEITVTSQGPVAMFFFEPVEYTGEKLDEAKAIIADIVGSYLFPIEEKEEDEGGIKPPKVIEERDPFVRLFMDLFNDSRSPVNTDDWIEVQGDRFGFMMNPQFSVHFYPGETSETADLGYSGTVVSKIVVGEIDTSSPIEGVFKEVIEEFLAVLAVEGYEIVDSFSSVVKEGTAVNIYAVDFTGVLCWIIIYSETDSIASFGPGDYFIFIGLPDSDNLSQWAEWYAGMVISLDF